MTTNRQTCPRCKRGDRLEFDPFRRALPPSLPLAERRSIPPSQHSGIATYQRGVCHRCLIALVLREESDGRRHIVTAERPS